MSIQYSDLANTIKKSFNCAKSEIIVISAFTTSDATSYLLKDISEGVKVTLVTRWSKHDIVSGSSDLNVAKIIFDNGGRVFRNPLLHAKIYMIDKEKLLFGSANMTCKGLGIGNLPINIECLSHLEDVTIDDIFFINSLINDSSIVDQSFIDELQNQLSETTSQDWDESRIKDIALKPKGIFVNDFPYCNTPNMLMGESSTENVYHDLKIIGCNLGNISNCDIAKSFEKSNVITWFDRKLIESMSFGELSKTIHNSLLDDPKPYRKDIKELESNLFNWIQALLNHKYKIYIPDGGYSQIIERIN